jgi:DNA-binding GntR family transcriptional regulator
VKILAVSKVEQVRQAILTEIVRGNLAPGERLFEAKLSKELGVSQATVNAALQDLHNQGLVTKLLNRSTNVNRYTSGDIYNLFSVRMILEPAASEAVAAAWSADAERTLLVCVEEMRRSARTADAGDWCIVDYSFHQEVYRLTGNPFLVQAGKAIAAAPFAYILCGQLQPLPADDYPSMAEEHYDMIGAMRAGPEAAGRITRELILKWHQHSMLVLKSAQRVAG